MTKAFIIAGLAAAVMSAGCVQQAEAQRLTIATTKHAHAKSISSEAKIGQARGRIYSRDEAARNPRSGPAVRPTAVAPNNSVNCTQQDSNSQLCYTATQQSRPITR